MISADSFEILAEIAFALVGFSGVVVALGKSKLSSTEQALRLRLLFLSGATALWGGLTPTIGSLLSVQNSWVVSAILFTPALAAVNAFAWLRLYRLMKTGGPSVMPPVFYVVTPLTVAALLWVIYSLLFQHSLIPASQFSASTLVLFLGLYHFYVLAIGGPYGDT